MRVFFLITAGTAPVLAFFLLPSPAWLKWTALGFFTGNILLMGLPGAILFFFFRPVLLLFTNRKKVFDPGDNLWPLAILTGIFFPLGMVPCYAINLSIHNNTVASYFFLSLWALMVFWAIITVLLSFLVVSGGTHKP